MISNVLTVGFNRRWRSWASGVFSSKYSGLSVFFFLNDTATTEIYTLSLHDALPISGARQGHRRGLAAAGRLRVPGHGGRGDRKSTRLNSSHITISYAVFCLKKK